MDEWKTASRGAITPLSLKSSRSKEYGKNVTLKPTQPLTHKDFAKFGIIPKGNTDGTTTTGKDNTNVPKGRPESYVLDSSSLVLK